MPVGDAQDTPRERATIVDLLHDAVAHRFGLEGGRELEWGGLDGAGLRTAAEELARGIAALQHDQRLVLQLIDERGAFQAEGSRDAADWAADRLGMSRQEAAGQLDLARKLEELPALAEKAAAGELSSEQAAPAVQLADTARQRGDAGADTIWATNAPSMGVAALRRRAAKARRPGAADHAAARAARTFDAWTVGQELRFRGSAPIDDGALLLKAIERSMPERDGTSTLGQRQLDGLLALASTNVSSDADPDRATVVMVAELAAICDDDPAATAELESGQPLATETARRLVCDSRLSVLVQDVEGRAVGLGTTARTVTPALRRALMVRDGHCRFGDCTSRRLLHGHHIRHWPAPTVMGNLAMVCFSHHHALHEGGWDLVGDPFGELVAVHPDGRWSAPNLPQSVIDREPSGERAPDAGPPPDVQLPLDAGPPHDAQRPFEPGPPHDAGSPHDPGAAPLPLGLSPDRRAGPVATRAAPAG